MLLLFAGDLPQRELRGHDRDGHRDDEQRDEQRHDQLYRVPTLRRHVSSYRYAPADVIQVAMNKPKTVTPRYGNSRLSECHHRTTMILNARAATNANPAATCRSTTPSCPSRAWSIPSETPK